MTSGIVTLLALLGFLAVVVYVFFMKRKSDFDEQAHLPLEGEGDKAGDGRDDQGKSDSGKHGESRS